MKESVADGLDAPDRGAPQGGRGVRRGHADRHLRAPPRSIRQTRLKVEAYAEYLGEEKERLEAELVESAELLRSGSRTSGPTRWCSSPTARSVGQGRHGRGGRRRNADQGNIKGQIAYKVYKVHPDTEVVSDGQFVHSKFVPAAGARPRGRGPSRASLV